MVRVTVTVDSNRIRVPLKTQITTREFLDDVVSRLERVNPNLASDIRNKKRPIETITRQTESLATLPRDESKALVPMLNNGDELTLLLGGADNEEKPALTQSTVKQILKTIYFLSVYF